MNENYRSGMTGISVLMVFLILCVSVFAMLTLSSAQSEWSLTQKNQQQVDTYYACDSEAQQMLSHLSALIKSSDDLELALSGSLFQLTGNRVDFETPTVNQRKMVVSAIINEDGSLRIIDYRLVNTENINYDSGLDVYIPE